jgi:hypothetical protein
LDAKLTRAIFKASCNKAWRTDLISKQFKIPAALIGGAFRRHGAWLIEKFSSVIMAARFAPSPAALGISRVEWSWLTKRVSRPCELLVVEWNDLNPDMQAYFSQCTAA